MSALRTEAPAATKRGRLFYLDWLRVLAVLGIFYQYAAKGPWLQPRGCKPRREAA